MNHGLSTRSALVRHAERSLGIRNRPREARDIFSAINPIPRERRAQRRHDSAVIFAICTAIISVFLLVQFIGQVLP